MSIVKARLVWPHEDLGEDTFHEWIIQGDFKGNSRGVSNPNMSYANWLKVRCNNPDCAGWGAVNKEAVVALLEEVSS
jgi:hypothetical protein